jgi:WS/DGAT/MGAT family acyltransferase
MLTRRGKLERVAKVPRTRFNGTVSPYRVFTGINVPLADIKAIKNAVEGATVNDVAIAIVGGALRRYLEDKKELPPQSLVAMAPVNVRNPKDEAGGNIVSTMAVKVYSEVEDPRARLEAVHRGTNSAKALNNAIGAKSMTDYAQFIPSTLTAQAARLASRWHLANQISPFYNCVITNVPGPQVPLYCAGARMITNYGTGPCADSLGLFHVISSYCGGFTVSATCCREMMPDPGFYRECLQRSFEELRDATISKGGAKRQTRRKTPAKRKKSSSAAGRTRKKAATRKSAPTKTSASRKKAPGKKAPARKSTTAARARPAARPKVRPKKAAAA